MKRPIVAAGAVVFLVLFVRTAWVNDDAYITFRTVDGFRTHVIDGPADREFDAIRIVPAGGDSVYGLGQLPLLR